MSTPLAATPVNGGIATPGNPPLQVVLYGPDGNGGWDVLDLGGGGDVQTVAGVAPDEDGNVDLTHADLGPVQIADLGFDPETQAEWDAASTTINAELAKKALLKPKVYVAGRGQATGILTSGQSLTAGAGLANPTTQRPSAQLAGLLTEVADDRMLGVSGSDLLYADPALGGWGKLWTGLDQSNPATAALGIGLLFSGLNGLSSNFASYSTPGASGDLVREAALSYLRTKPGKYRKASNGVFAYSGFADATVDASTGQQAMKYGGAVGSTVTETVTLDEAGTHTLYVVENSTFGSSKWKVEENGVTLATVDNSLVNSSGYHPVAIRLPNQAAGAHTYVLTLTAIPSGVPFSFFLGSGDEAASPPVILDILQYKPSSYAPYAGSAHVPTDADVDLLNARIRAVDGLFDDAVISVTTGGLLDKRRAAFQSDGLHTTAFGDTLLALAAFRALDASPLTSALPITTP